MKIRAVDVPNLTNSLLILAIEVPFSNKLHFHAQQDIDFSEEYGGKLYGYGFTYHRKKKKAPGLWLDTYSNASDRDNFFEFVA